MHVRSSQFFIQADMAYFHEVSRCWVTSSTSMWSATPTRVNCFRELCFRRGRVADILRQPGLEPMPPVRQASVLPPSYRNTQVSLSQANWVRTDGFLDAWREDQVVLRYFTHTLVSGKRNSGGKDVPVLDLGTDRTSRAIP